MFICLHLRWCFPPSHFSLSYWGTSVRSLCRQSQQSILPSDTQTNTNTHCGHRVDVSCIQTPLLFFLAQACVKPEGKGHRQKNTTGDFQQLNRSVQPREHRVKCKKTTTWKCESGCMFENEKTPGFVVQQRKRRSKRNVLFCTDGEWLISQTSCCLPQIHIPARAHKCTLIQTKRRHDSLSTTSPAF